ncbi:MAG: hypothetical protein KDE68_12705 [Rhodocyclaceae bacterium]|nr:hypothetical protein [Rhodocyclaceae bacterium]
MNNARLRITLAACFALLTGGGALAQTRMAMPLEEIGVVTAVSPATSTITVDGRRLKVTTATRVTADDPGMDYSQVSRKWLGRQVGMDTNADEIRQLHIFGSDR